MHESVSVGVLAHQESDFQERIQVQEEDRGKTPNEISNFLANANAQNNGASSLTMYFRFPKSS